MPNIFTHFFTLFLRWGDRETPRQARCHQRHSLYPFLFDIFFVLCRFSDVLQGSLLVILSSLSRPTSSGLILAGAAPHSYPCVPVCISCPLFASGVPLVPLASLHIPSFPVQCCAAGHSSPSGGGRLSCAVQYLSLSQSSLHRWIQICGFPSLLSSPLTLSPPPFIFSGREGRRQGGKGKEYLISPPEHIYFSGDTTAALLGFNGIVGVPFYYFLQQFRPDIKAGKSYSSLEPRRKRICRSRASCESRVIASR